jgi:hypothetical protein
MAIMCALAVLAAITFSRITGTLFAHGLADPHVADPNIKRLYMAYIRHRRQTDGRIGALFWIHGVSAGLFIVTGVVYSVFRFIIPRIL